MGSQMPYQGQPAMFYNSYEEMYPIMGPSNLVRDQTLVQKQKELVMGEGEEEEPIKVEQKDPVEAAKRKRHLEMNRLAAARCRENKKRRTEALRAQDEAYKQERVDLRKEILELRERVVDMKTVLIANINCPDYRQNHGLTMHEICTIMNNFTKDKGDPLLEDEGIRELRRLLFGDPPTDPEAAPEAEDSEDKAE